MLNKNKELPVNEQDLILSHILKKSREYVLAHPEIHPVECSRSEIAKGEFNRVKLTKKQEARYKKLVKRRRNHEPLAYILGHQGFYGLNFKVSKAVLVPRPETEHLVDEVISNLKLAAGNKNKKIATIDVGTGSGNIIISIVKNLWTSNVHNGHSMSFHATDISEKALRVARYNARKYKVDKKINFIKSDMLNYFLNNSTIKQFSNLIIVANLPYLSRIIYSKAPPDVKNFEPKLALLSGKDGLDHYKKLFQQIKLILNQCSIINIQCLIEFGPEQKSKIQKIIKQYFPKSKPLFQKDLAGKWRVLSFEI